MFFDFNIIQTVSGGEQMNCPIEAMWREAGELIFT
jgi:hypothetical protein